MKYETTPRPWYGDELGITGSGPSDPHNVVLLWAGPKGIKAGDARILENAGALYDMLRQFVEVTVHLSQPYVAEVRGQAKKLLDQIEGKK